MNLILDYEKTIESNGSSYVLDKGMKFVCDSDSEKSFMVDEIYRTSNREIALALKIVTGDNEELLVREIKISDIKHILEITPHTLVS